MVAGAADKIVETRAFAAKNHHETAGEIELVVGSEATLVETDDPEAAALELFERADEVDDAGDTQVFGGSGTGFDGGGAERRGAALGDEDTVDPGAIGDAKQGAQVLRVLNAVESKDEAG